MKNRFEEYTREQIREIAPNGLVVIPVGAVEQHGKHLPVGTDSLILNYLVSRAAEKTQNENILFAPAIWYGNSHHHLMFPGTMSLRAETFISMLVDLGDSLVKGGFKRMFFLYSHGGNEIVAKQAAVQLTLQHHDIIVGSGGYWDLAKEYLDRELSKYGVKVRAHGGVSETSMIMFLADHLVDREAQASYTPEDFSDHKRVLFSSLRQRRPAFVRRSNYMEGIKGISDLPHQASRELGEKLLEGAVDQIVEYFNELIEHP